MIIAIDGAATDLSLALATPEGEPIDEAAWTSPQRQSAELLPRLLDLLDRNGRTLAETGAIGVGTGPGSFTGLRVAMALAKGLSVALDRPIVGIPSLEAWLEAEATAEAALVRAGAREAYLLVRGTPDAVIADRDELPNTIRAAVVAAPVELADAFGLARATRPRGAVAIARRTAARLEREPAGDDVRRLEPIYLRAPRGVATEGEGRVKWL